MRQLNTFERRVACSIITILKRTRGKRRRMLLLSLRKPGVDVSEDRQKGIGLRVVCGRVCRGFGENHQDHSAEEAQPHKDFSPFNFFFITFIQRLNQ